MTLCGVGLQQLWRVGLWTFVMVLREGNQVDATAVGLCAQLTWSSTNSQQWSAPISNDTSKVSSDVMGCASLSPLRWGRPVTFWCIWVWNGVAIFSATKTWTGIFSPEVVTTFTVAAGRCLKAVCASKADRCMSSLSDVSRPNWLTRFVWLLDKGNNELEVLTGMASWNC